MPKMTLLTPEYKREYNNEYYKKNSNSINASRKARKNTVVRGRMSALIGNSRQRAKEKGWEHDLTLDFLCALWEEQKGLCALTGVPLSLEPAGPRWSSSLVSIDRIDNSLGYTQDNVWLVTVKINFAKGTQTLEEFFSMCKLVVENYGA